MEADRHLSPADLAAREGVPLSTIYGWNRNGSGPRYMKVGKHVRYRLEDVLAWENSQFTSAEPAAS